MLTELTWNQILIKGSSSVLNEIGKRVFISREKNHLYNFLSLNESMPKRLKLIILSLERISPTEMTISVDSNGDLMNEYLLELSKVYGLHITCKYEDDSMDIGGTFVCKNGTVLKDLSYSYLAHRYIEGGIDDIASDVEDYIREGEMFDDFMSEQGLWTIVTKDDRELIYDMFNQE